MSDHSANPAAPARDYADLGDRVASVLNAAEEAAAAIRAEAERDAEAVRRDGARAARAASDEERERAAGEAGRLVASAIADAEAIRDAARAAASRIAEEGHRRLAELRDEGRRLESRFERAVEDLNDLIGQLEAVVQAAVAPAAGVAQPDAEDAQGAPVLSVVADPDTPVEADLEPEAELADDLWPRAADEAPAGQGAPAAPGDPDGRGAPRA